MGDKAKLKPESSIQRVVDQAIVAEGALVVMGQPDWTGIGKFAGATGIWGIHQEALRRE